jgi:hypothetical protein
MNPPHTLALLPFGFLLAATVLSGCAATNGATNRSGTIRITSEPAGAVAYADGAELGVTPLEIVPESHFRAGFVGLSYRYSGTLSLKKPGCEPWSTAVNDYVLSKDVHVRLICDSAAQPAVEPAPAPAGPAQPLQGDPYVERLERIESLHKKGLIGDEEYKQLRARVLEKL